MYCHRNVHMIHEAEDGQISRNKLTAVSVTTTDWKDSVQRFQFSVVWFFASFVTLHCLIFDCVALSVVITACIHVSVEWNESSPLPGTSVDNAVERQFLPTITRRFPKTYLSNCVACDEIKGETNFLFPVTCGSASCVACRHKMWQKD